MTVQELALTESRSLREQYADRTDVLDKVKALAMLPDGVHVTTDMVARYYEVPSKTIESLVKNNAEELKANGRRVLEGAEVREFATSFDEVADLALSPKARRLAKLDTDVALAKKVGVDPTTVYRVLNGKTEMSARFIAGIVDAFGAELFPDLFELVPETEGEAA